MTNKAALQKVSDAKRVHQAKQGGDQRRACRLKLCKARIEPNLPTMIASAPAPTSDNELPMIHQALGRFIETHVPNLYWDLTNPDIWTYKRPLSEEEMQSSPFSPEQEKMILVLNPKYNWTITIAPRPGYRFITMRCFRSAMSTCLQQRVSRAIWDSADLHMKLAIALAFYRRTGKLPPATPTLDAFSHWQQMILFDTDHEYTRTSIVKQMTSYVCRAKRGPTQLRTVDLLGSQFMFAGLVFLSKPNIWGLTTTWCHIAGMAHHLLPPRSGLVYEGLLHCRDLMLEGIPDGDPVPERVQMPIQVCAA